MADGGNVVVLIVVCVEVILFLGFKCTGLDRPAAMIELVRFTFSWDRLIIDLPSPDEELEPLSTERRVAQSLDLGFVFCHAEFDEILHVLLEK